MPGLLGGCGGLMISSKAAGDSMLAFEPDYSRPDTNHTCRVGVLCAGCSGTQDTLFMRIRVSNSCGGGRGASKGAG